LRLLGLVSGLVSGSDRGKLLIKAAHREVVESEGTYALREPGEAYGLKFAAEKAALRAENAFIWNESIDEATT
jgi:hypothetical protein